MINRFCGEYFYLCNFFEAPVLYDGVLYKNNEAAFQAQKVVDPVHRNVFADLDPAAAKRKGSKVKLRSDWEEVKEQIMYEICLAKFTQHPDLLEKLLLTGNRPLEEGNTWDDREWGTVNGVGENKLGRILMRVRDEVRSKSCLEDLLVSAKHRSELSGNFLEAELYYTRNL